MATVTPWWIWLLLPILFAAPWITAIIWFWPRRNAQGELPPSMAEMARQRWLR
jgi:hypothetical protein